MTRAGVVTVPGMPCGSFSPRTTSWSARAPRPRTATARTWGWWQIRRAHPGTGVVVLSQYAEPSDIVELLSDGVAGLGDLLKERVVRLEELVAALHVVRRGGSALDPQVVEALVARRAAADRRQPPGARGAEVPRG